jgi:hypothetical protein
LPVRETRIMPPDQTTAADIQELCFKTMSPAPANFSPVFR